MIYYFFYYLLALLLLEVIYFDVLKSSQKKYYLYFKLTWWILTLVAILKYGIAPDTPNYMAAYSSMPPLQEFRLSTFDDYRFNPLCTLAFSFCKTISDNYIMLQILQGGLFFYSFYKILTHFGLNKFYLLLFFYLYTYFISGMCTVRESFAVSFGNLAFTYLLRKEWIKYYLLTAIALGFHSGAIILLMFPLFLMLNPIKVRKYIILIVALSIVLFYIIYHFNNEISLLLIFGDGSASRYLMNIGDNSFNLFAFLRNGLIIIFVYFCVNTKTCSKEMSCMLYMGVFYIMIDILSSSILPIAFRIMAYLIIPFLFVIKNIIEKLNSRKLIPCFLFIFLVYYQPYARFIFQMTELNKMDESGYDPYCSIISDDKSFYDRYINSASASDYINK